MDFAKFLTKIHLLRRNYSLDSLNSFINTPYGIVTVLALSLFVSSSIASFSKNRRRCSDRTLGFLYPCL